MREELIQSRKSSTREMPAYIRIDLKRWIELKFGSVLKLAEFLDENENKLYYFLAGNNSHLEPFKQLASFTGASLDDIAFLVREQSGKQFLIKELEKNGEKTLGALSKRIPGVNSQFLYRVRDGKSFAALSFAELVASALGITIHELCIGPIKSRQ